MVQQWWQSRTIWTIFLGFLFNVLVQTGIVPASTNVQMIIDGILSLLAIIFRWAAQGPIGKTQ